MKQIIPFVSDVSLDTKISEITSIALEHNLQMENSDSVVGVFTISGKYKINEISVNEEVFEKEIPFDITLDDKYDASKVMIDIDDFYYEIINEEFLRVHIDVLVNNLVYAKKEELERCIEDEDITDIMPKDETIKENESEDTMEELVKDEEVSENKEVMKVDEPDERKEEISDVASEISSNLLLEKEQYVTYKVHIIRNDETIDMVMEKYGVTKEELEKYNSLDNITIGTKIIVPVKDE